MAEHITEQIFEYLEDALEPAEKSAFEAHVAGCAECAAAVEKRRKFIGDLNAALAPPRLSSLELLNKVRAMHAERVAAREKRVARWRLVTLVGALVAVAAVILVFVPLPRTGGPHVIGAPSEGHAKVVESATCRVGIDSFTVALEFPSGGAAGGKDLELLFIHGDRILVASQAPGELSFVSPNAATVPEPGEEDEIEGGASVCDKVLATALPEGRVMVLVEAGGTGMDTLVAAVYDTKSENVLDWHVLPAVYTQPVPVRQLADGFSVFAVKEWKGGKPVGAPVGMVESWVKVGFDGKHVVETWDEKKVVRH